MFILKKYYLFKMGFIEVDIEIHNFSLLYEVEVKEE